MWINKNNIWGFNEYLNIDSIIEFDELANTFDKIYKYFELSVRITDCNIDVRLNIDKKNDKNKKKILEGIFDIDQIKDLEINNIVMQLLYEIFFEYVFENLYKDEDYFFTYLEKLYKSGMKFYWRHLISRITCYPYKYTSGFIDKYNNLLIDKYGIQDPNCVYYLNKITKSGLTYMPLIAQVKIAEDFLQFGEFENLHYILKDIDNFIKIGCDPHFNLVDYYNAGSFLVKLSTHVNKNYNYDKKEIENMDILTLNKFLVSNDLNDKENNKILIKFILEVINKYEKLNYIVDLENLNITFG